MNPDTLVARATGPRPYVLRTRCEWDPDAEPPVLTADGLHRFIADMRRADIRAVGRFLDRMAFGG